MSVAHVLCVFFHKECNESGVDDVKGLLVMHVDVDINDMVKYHIYMLFFFNVVFYLKISGNFLGVLFEGVFLLLFFLNDSMLLLTNSLC